MGRRSREKQQRRAAPKPPPVGRRQPGLLRSVHGRIAAAAVPGAAVVAVVLAVVFTHSGRAAVRLGPALTDESALAGLQTGPPPWPAEHAKLAGRLDQLGLPRLRMEANDFHIHQHLDLYVDGSRLTVPALIGIDPQRRYLDPLHTHDTSGIVHIESPTTTDYTLGQLFAVWGVRLTGNCVGGLCDTAGRQLRAYVNGERVGANPARIVLTAHQEVVLAYGTPSQLPHPIPSRYAFPAGL